MIVLKFFKKNQIIIYVFVLMLMTAGYLNYIENAKKQSIETTTQIEENEKNELNNTNELNESNGLNEVNNVSNDSSITNESNKSSDDKQIAGIGDATLVNSSDISDVEEKNDYFAKSKLERDTMYSQMLESYEKVLNSSNSLEIQKQTATQEIQRINEIKNGIMICENLIQTKGFENSVIFVNGESVSVILESVEEIGQEKIAQVQNIIARELNAQIENIHIVAKKK